MAGRDVQKGWRPVSKGLEKVKEGPVSLGTVTSGADRPPAQPGPFLPAGYFLTRIIHLSASHAFKSLVLL